MSTQAGVARFDAAVAQMPGLLDRLQAAAALLYADHAAVPGYARHLPVRRRRRPRVRRADPEPPHQAAPAHQPAVQAESGVVAFNLAKRDANLADVPVTATRVALQIEERFAAHFAAAKAQVAGMRVQWIELEDPIERTLFEMYAALALVTTEFNSFETH